MQFVQYNSYRGYHRPSPAPRQHPPARHPQQTYGEIFITALLAAVVNITCSKLYKG